MLAIREKQEVSRSLSILAPLIKKELKAGDRAGLEHYREAGKLLLEAKAQIEHGEWLNWLAQNFHLSQPTAYIYMRLARKSIENPNERAKVIASYNSESLSKFNGDHRPSHEPAWSQPIKKAMDDPALIERLRQDTQKRLDESKLQRELGLKLIDIGFKVLASKLHPDKGGSTEAMERLNRVRDRLKNAV